MKSTRLGLIAILWISVLQVEAQSTGRLTVSSQPSAPPQVDSSGYLSKTPASPLRFATPPRPPVASLPPLAITQDPKPVFSARFVEPTADVTLVPAVAAPSAPDLATSVQWPELVSQIPTKEGGIPESLPAKRAIAPQSLVHFFGLPSSVRESQLDIGFQLPGEAKAKRIGDPNQNSQQAIRRVNE